MTKVKTKSILFDKHSEEESKFKNLLKRASGAEKKQRGLS